MTWSEAAIVQAFCRWPGHQGERTPCLHGWVMIAIISTVLTACRDEAPVPMGDALSAVSTWSFHLPPLGIGATRGLLFPASERI